MPQLRVETEGPILVVTFTNPPDGFMDEATVPELDAAIRLAEEDAAIRAVIFTGGLPGVFIRHYSVVELEHLSKRLREQNLTIDPARQAPESHLHQVFRRVEELPQPTIAAINGTAMGGGFEFALCCDIRIAEEGDYSLGLPEVNIGILPGAGGTQKLARIVGVGRALELTMRGRTLTPTEAFEMGLVHEVAPAGASPATARNFAREFAKKSPLALRHIKRLVRSSVETSLADGLALERTLFLDTLVSDDAFRLMGEMNRGERDIRDR